MKEEISSDKNEKFFSTIIRSKRLSFFTIYDLYLLFQETEASQIWPYYFCMCARFKFEQWDHIGLENNQTGLRLESLKSNKFTSDLITNGLVTK